MCAAARKQQRILSTTALNAVLAAAFVLVVTAVLAARMRGTARRRRRHRHTNVRCQQQHGNMFLHNRAQVNPATMDTAATHDMRAMSNGMGMRPGRTRVDR
jgi:flagellar biosynthesis/type III secretory pathway M-ring protein FliF/YscJ